MSAHPWMKFYPRDWRGDQALRAVSIAARGLWMEMMCIMHEASPYGHLVLGGRAVSNDALARMAGTGVDEVSALLIELESAGVLSRTRKAVIYSRRMVKDKSRAEKGRKSVSKRWSQTVDIKTENDRPNRLPNREPITQKPEARVLLSKDNRPEADSDKVFWANAKAFIGGRNPGALIGKWSRDYSRTETAAAISAAQIERAVEPVSFIEAALRKRRAGARVDDLW